MSLQYYQLRHGQEPLFSNSKVKMLEQMHRPSSFKFLSGYINLLNLIVVFSLLYSKYLPTEKLQTSTLHHIQPDYADSLYIILTSLFSIEASNPLSLISQIFSSSNLSERCLDPNRYYDEPESGAKIACESGGPHSTEEAFLLTSQPYRVRFSVRLSEWMGNKKTMRSSPRKKNYL